MAAIRSDDDDHELAIGLIQDRRDPLITTWPCMTEAMYLVGTAGQSKLIQQIEHHVYGLPYPTFEDALRACQLMRQYADTPMDFADASLVVLAENTAITQILTLDEHFYAYRINGTTPFDVSPWICDQILGAPSIWFGPIRPGRPSRIRLRAATTAHIPAVPN